MMMELLIIPVVTTILTTIVLYVKENIQEKQVFNRSINEQKLKELYNELFSISLIYTDKLEQSFFLTLKGMLEVNGELIPESDNIMIKEAEIWDELIDKIRGIIHGKLHLLEEDDLAHWHHIELIILGERFDDTVNIEKYKELEEFLLGIALKYKKLYKIYHKK